jgi:hypothetical protein
LIEGMSLLRILNLLPPNAFSKSKGLSTEFSNLIDSEISSD